MEVTVVLVNMKRYGYRLVSALVVGVVILAFGPQLWAQRIWSQQTRVTFSGPVEVPADEGLILPAGSYVFRLLDSPADRHIVQIFNEDQTVLYTTVLAIPNYRRVPTDKTVITFAERPAGLPPAVQAWFYPGNNYGHEFVYPRSRAEQLAAFVAQPVLAIPNEVAEVAAEVRPTPPPTAPRIVELVEAPVTAISPEGEVIPLAEVVETPPTLVAALPRTASGMPILVLVGVLSIAAGLSVRQYRLRMS